jgi:aspartate-semialdehyde dehydrogenase
VSLGLKKLGFIGWRGMVGSVLLNRMKEEKDFDHFETSFFTTSQVGQPAPPESHHKTLLDAYSFDDLMGMDILLTCQGGDYTKKVHNELRQRGWKGYWVDAASTLRMETNSVLVLDPLNKNEIQNSIEKNILDYVGANCTVSLMLLALAGPLKAGAIDWVGSHTYQAASGAGAQNMKELLRQMGHLYKVSPDEIDDPKSDILSLDKKISDSLQGKGDYPKELFRAPLGGSLIPWIDSAMENGQTREEWKAMVEANKLLSQKAGTLKVDGTCVRIGAMRSHSQALTVKCKEGMSEGEFIGLIKDSHSWLKFVPNNKEATLRDLNPAVTSGTLDIAVGRVRKLNIGPEYFNVFTVGDQLLWGAAEPLRRFLRILIEG